ncbi:LpqN/LpqT family lipoprotein [Mycobacterium avium]|nr:LpqN/LpqT family lipoprotein [Mycobacterium avium]
MPGQGEVYVLRVNAGGLESDRGPLMDATNLIDGETTITGWRRRR